MFRLLGILMMGNLLSGGRHRRRAIRRGLLFGALLGYLANRDYDMDRVRKEAREAARKARKAARDASGAFREEVRNARRAASDRLNTEHRHEVHTEAEARKAETAPVIRALPTSGTHEAMEIEELVGDLERNAADAATAVDVPTIDFPEEDEKYHASRKYGYA